MNRKALLSLSTDDLIALILAQQAQIEASTAQVRLLSARVAELEAKLNAPGKTPDNSHLPPSKGRSPTCRRPPRSPGPAAPVSRAALAEHPDRVIEARLAACPHSPTPWAHALSPADQAEIRAYDHIDLPPIRPIVTRINRHRGVCPAAARRSRPPHR